MAIDGLVVEPDSMRTFIRSGLRNHIQRRGWDSNPRGSFRRPHDFQSCTLSHSVTPPGEARTIARAPSILLAVLLALLVGTPAASAAITYQETLGFAPSDYVYTTAPDDTFWRASGSGSSMTVSHVDEDGNNLGDGFTVSGGYYPLSIGYYGGRVYIVNSGSTYHNIYSWDPSAANVAASAIVNDYETSERIGSNQATLRIGGSGSSVLALGQDNKIALLSLANVNQDHPYYPQSIYGWGINDNPGSSPMGMGFEGCVKGNGPPSGGTPPPNCGTYSGRTGESVGHLNYPIDSAVGPDSSIYVLQGVGGNRITQLALPPEGSGLSGYQPLDSFPAGGGGSGTGELDQPSSMVRGPDGNLYVSDNNARISEFNTAGGFIQSFGWGVRDGTNEFQTCSVDTGGCRKGLIYFSRLDINSEGDLYAGTAYSAGVQVFDLGLTGGGGGPAGPAGPTGPTGPAGKVKVTLKASSNKVDKGDKVKLGATLKKCDMLPGASILIEEKDGRDWDKVGKAKSVDKKCKSQRKVKVSQKSIYRATALSSAGAVLASSPAVTIKLK